MGVVIRLDTTRLDEIQGEKEKRAGEIVRSTAFEIQAIAQINAPVDTGALRSSIETVITGAMSAIIQDGVEYGIFVELGTSRMAAQPFLTPAVEQVRPKFDGRWKELFL